METSLKKWIRGFIQSLMIDFDYDRLLSIIGLAINYASGMFAIMPNCLETATKREISSLF